jgi:glycine reductase
MGTGGIRIVHYVNQFFAGLGGEERAGVGPARLDRLAGPSLALQRAAGEAARVVATVSCGDNHVAERGAAVDEIVDLIRQERPDIVIAGPAFSAGRYALACGHVCARAREVLGVTVVTGMHPANPAADLFRTRMHVVRTRETAAGMVEAVETMARLALRLHAGQELGPSTEEGHLPTGRRLHFLAPRTAAERTLDLLLRKVRGEPFETEWPVPTYGRVPPAPPIADLGRATIALVTTGGLIPRGNPDRLESAYATKWLRYPLAGLDTLEPDAWQSVHGGFDTTIINADPHRVVPLDSLRALERKGVIGKLHDELFTTVGNTSSIPTMRRFAREMARALGAAGVDGVLLTST